ncbi:hypothetical protein ACF0H5_012233 [Mactra antiquata]
MGVGELCFSYFSGPKAKSLIVGDSNVHRISSAVMNGDDCCLFDCLPVSGARYVNDLKGLRMKMKKMLQEEDYHHVFVHLGSNDVLCPLDVFYRNVTEMVDLIHEKTSSTIYLCEIPPRDLDRRRSARTTPEKIWKYRRWIYTANDLLKELSSHIPYVCYLQYAVDPVRHLSRDGLHLNDDGGRLCFRTIQDNAFAYYPARADMSADVSLDVMQWPALQDNDLDIVSETVSVRRKTYASIVKEMPAVVTVFDGMLFL